MEQTLGKRIVENRKRMGLTQDQLAEKLGVTAQAVSKWENDQSCPDITTIPQLADIFGISTDALLGREEPAIEPQVVEKVTEEKEGKSHWEFNWTAGRKGSLGFGFGVLLVGVCYLLSELLHLGHSFWDVLWPCAVLTFGLTGLFPGMSFFNLACTLFGVWKVTELFVTLPFGLDGGVLWAVIIVLFGISLLADALKKPKKGKAVFTYTDKNGQVHKGHSVNQFECDEDSFDYTASFGESSQRVDCARLEQGDVSVSFGEYTLDLSEVEEVAEDCHIDANCSFGELNILVPKRFQVKAVSATSFSAFHISGHPDDSPEGVINLDANVSFGEINVKYI